MRNITLHNITEAAVASFSGLPDPRQRELVQGIVRHLHAFAREHQLTHAEWRTALGFLHRTAAMTNQRRSEFSLLSDVTGVSSLVDLLATDPAATPGSVLGPFHAVGSPWVANPASLIGDIDGQRVLLRGRVTDAQGQPLPAATLDFWQNASNGNMLWALLLMAGAALAQPAPPAVTADEFRVTLLGAAQPSACSRPDCAWAR